MFKLTRYPAWRLFCVTTFSGTERLRSGSAAQSNKNLFAFQSTAPGPLAFAGGKIAVFFVSAAFIFLASNIRKSQKKEFI
jgi:hypothetical protein